jgi:glycosyltransferase involved in cell wall biosynthesis
MKVSILIPCHSLNYLESAIESIANQTLPSSMYETILVGDRINLVDAEKILSKKLNNFSIYNSDNPGIVPALNLGLEKCTSELVARMDEDDFMESKRLSLQLDFMNKHPDCVALGGQLKLINAEGKFIGISRFKKNISNEDLLNKSPIAHPAAMFRKDTALNVGAYRDSLPEDWDLWARLYEEGQISNLNEFILRYRVHSNQLSRQAMYKQSTSRKLIGTSIFARESGLIDAPVRPNDSENWLENVCDQLRIVSKNFLEFEKKSEIDAEFQDAWMSGNLTERYINLLKVYIKAPKQCVFNYLNLVINKIYYLILRYNFLNKAQ